MPPNGAVAVAGQEAAVVVVAIVQAGRETRAVSQTEALTEVFIGLGANLGDAQATVTAAIAQIAALPKTRLLRQSSLYKTAPVDAGGDDYINAVVAVSTALAPLDLLHALQNLEQHAGRLRPYRNAPRTLDIDILLYGEETVDSPDLTLPHPRMLERAFVLLPLAEIAPMLVSASQLDAVSFVRSGQTVARVDQCR
jgi:2-amino-4-hydroxy-6-hydroxymethyldihydropteridine diphosphokinase